MNIDVKLDINEIFDKAFSALAKAMNVAEEQLLPVLVKQMFVEGIVGLAILGFLLLAIIFLLILGIVGSRNLNETLTGVGFIGAAILSFVWIAAAFAEGYLLESVTKTFNPEYAVIEEVVDMANDLLGNNKEK